MILVVPKDCWHRFDSAAGVKVLTATPKEPLSFRPRRRPRQERLADQYRSADHARAAGLGSPLLGGHVAEDPADIDEFAAGGIETAEDLRKLFEPNFYFGCEADDRLAAWAFDEGKNPFGARLQAMFSSDLGHWDVLDMNDVLTEAYELREDGLFDETDFRDFTFTYPAMVHARVNPDFFKGTAVEGDVEKLAFAVSSSRGIFLRRDLSFLGIM